jgi:hypothetical protein
MCVDCGTPTSALADLTRARIEGLVKVKKQPARGWRDTLALFGTAFGMLGVSVAGAMLTSSPAGVLLGGAYAMFGYNKQFWKMGVKRGPRLDAVAPRERPAGEVLIGVAQPFERTIGPDALAIATTIESPQGVIVRAIEAAPFWMVLDDRRVLVLGECWVASLVSQYHHRVFKALRELGAGELPIAHVRKQTLRVAQVTIAPGDLVAVTGRVRAEQVPGIAGYRDSMGETIRGEPGALAWIERLAR